VALDLEKDSVASDNHPECYGKSQSGMIAWIQSFVSGAGAGAKCLGAAGSAAELSTCGHLARGLRPGKAINAALPRYAVSTRIPVD
jgi:hypothetical protein